ncbi:MAG: hypothetical protein AAF844_00230 [Pseudomonadota bacterium]
MAEPTDDLSAEMEEARREMRRGLMALHLECPDAVVKGVSDLVYRAVTLSEHEAYRRGLADGAKVAPA